MMPIMSRYSSPSNGSAAVRQKDKRGGGMSEGGTREKNKESRQSGRVHELK